MARTHRPWMMGIAIVVLLAGLGIGGVTLVSAMGIWFGLWDFRRAFALLRFAVAYANWIAIAGLIVTIGLLALSLLWKTGNASKLVSLALIGAVAAGLGYYVPESYRPPEGSKVPPIHDVSTDTVDPPAYVAVMPLRADAPNTTVYGGSKGMTQERLAQLQTDAYPDLKTRTIAQPPNAVFDRALAAVKQLGWKLVAAVPAEGRIEATDTTFWFRFKDDVVIRIRPAGDGTIIDARSLSRVGGGDAGTNARRLRAFFAAL